MSTLRLFVGWCLVFGTFAHGYLENTDAVVTLHAARALWHRGDPGLLAEDPLLTPAERQAIAHSGQTLPGSGGKQYAQFAIGHQVLLVPCVALGEWCARRFPAAERELGSWHGDDPAFGRHFFVRFFASWLPVPFAAGSAVLLFWLARTLGSSAREAGLVMLCVVAATQMLAGASETMSDGPGMCLLLATALAALRYERGLAGARALVALGLLGGATVLVRYPNAIPVAVCGVLAAWAAWRRQRRDLCWLAVGVLPGCVLLLLANWLRFGNVFETGYSGGANAHWFAMPWKWGIPLVLASPCKGILWFSVLLWPALALGLARPRAVGAMAWAVLLLPVLLVAHTRGWSGAQCWGIRYLTPSVVLFCTVQLALGKPWQRWPRCFSLTVLLGCLIGVGGLLTPYRGQQYLAAKATAVAYAPQIANQGLDPADAYHTDLRFSPLHTHWLYALQGERLERDLPAATAALFGVRVPADTPPVLHEDRGFRHVWWRVLPLPWWGGGLWLLACAVAVVQAGRRICR